MTRLLMRWLSFFFEKASPVPLVYLYLRLILFNAPKKSMLSVFKLPYKRNMARRWHVAGHKPPNQHREQRRIAHIKLGYMKAHGRLLVIIFTFGGLPQSPIPYEKSPKLYVGNRTLSGIYI